MSRPLILTTEKRALKERIKEAEKCSRIQAIISKSRIKLTDNDINEAYRLCTNAKEDMWRVMRQAHYLEYDIHEAKRRDANVEALKARQKTLQEQCATLEAKRLADLAALGITNITGL
jgi:hypothetical protein